jgi:HTH-type transcriptional repressor of NAD biosynthesis genes
MRFGTAVVIGKFYPPHRGHKLLIDAAAEQAREVTVIVCAKPADTIPGELRGRWLQEMHPAARVLVIDDRYDENDTAVWAANTIRWLGGAPDAVFTSEDYGERYAQAMGCAHVLVDRQREVVPCSATMIRSDPFAHWQYLEPPVRAWFARRVCVVGAESTGTTTLAEALARHYATVWVAEYGREFSVAKQARGETEWTSEEFVHVAQEQDAREERAARDANRVLICDTNSFATALWHRRYVGVSDPAVERATSLARCDLYLLTGDEIPFVPDGLRDGEHLRHEMHRWFEQALRAQAVPWLLVRGSVPARVQTAVAAIDALLR